MTKTIGQMPEKRLDPDAQMEDAVVGVNERLRWWRKRR